MKPRETMQLTLREIVLFAEGVHAARREDWRKQISHAHLIVSLGRVPRNKRLPSLQSLLPRDHTPAPADERKKRFWDAVRQMAGPGELGTAKKKKK